MAKPKRNRKQRPNGSNVPPGSEQPDESMLEELDEAPLVQPQVIDGKIVETWVPGKLRPR
jgi:hypothetical protein